MSLSRPTEKEPIVASHNLPEVDPHAFENDDMLDEVRMDWVDDPNPTRFKSHRALTRYARELQLVTLVMRDYSKQDPKVEQSLLDVTLRYGLKAHSIYNIALRQWLEDNPEAHSVLIVQKLVKDYEARGTDDLVRYHAKASKHPNERSTITVTTTNSSYSHVSDKSLEIIASQQQQIEQLKVQSKVSDLTIEEKEIEIKQNQIELKKKDLELSSYKQMANGFKNATEASEMPNVCFSHNVVGARVSTHPNTGVLNDETQRWITPVVEEDEPRHQPPSPLVQPKIGGSSHQSGRLMKSETWALPHGLLDDKGLCFTGKDTSEYPAYRHRMFTNFKELRDSHPNVLLRWIESTIDGQAKRFVRNAFAVLDPGEACDVIRDSLEEIYGRQDIILEHATQQVKRQSHSIGHNRQSLLEFRADLRNLRGVANSVGLSSKLKTPRMLGQLYVSLTEKLQIRFDAKHPANSWIFDDFLQFLSDEIAHIDALHMMHVELNEKPPDKVGPKFKSFATSTRQKSLTSMVAAIVDEQNRPAEPPKSMNIKPKCWLHPEAMSHNLVQCRSFLTMTLDERWRLAINKRLCFICFENSHTTKSCQSNNKCNKCKGFLHVLLHNPETTQAKTALVSRTKPTDKVLGYVTKNHHENSKVGLMLLTAIKDGNAKQVNNRVKFYGAIDTGATRTLCSKDLAEQLFGKWKSDSIQEYQLFDGSQMRCEAMMRELQLEAANGDILNLGARTFVDQSLPFAEYLPKLDDLPIRVDMVIGGDLVWEHILTKSAITQNYNTANAHPLGIFWLSSGRYDRDFFPNDLLATCSPLPESNNSAGSKVRLSPADREPELRRLELDPFYQSSSDDKMAMSISDENVLAGYKNTVKLVQVHSGKNHLQFPLPWAYEPINVPNNFSQAKRALLNLKRRLDNEPELRSQYCNKIDTAVKEGHLVKIPNEALLKDLNDDNKQQYYIPHFNTSQAKFRVVYDAAREYRGVSLNKLLNRGPIFMQSLRSILIRFGERQYGVAGDIANMFFQIRIAPEDRDMLRILWFSEPDMNGDVAAFEFQVAPYGLRCIPSIAGYAMMFTAENNIPDVSQDATSRVTRDMFVDDLITGVDCVTEGQKIIKEVSELLSSTGFTITKWNASCKDILADVAEKDLASAIRNIGENNIETNPRQCTLGVVWDTATDNMFVKKPHLTSITEGSFTKRQAVSLTHQFFDPLGWWSPFHTRLSLCCSKIVRQVTDWDAQVPLELIKEWNIAIRDLDGVESIPMPRRRVPNWVDEHSKFEYHVFADSSKNSAAAAIYISPGT